MFKQNNMKLEIYQQEAKRTLPDLGSEPLNLAHMVLGMGSEVSEFMDAIDKEDKVNMGEEIADKLWYTANYCNIRKYDFKDIISRANKLIELGVTSEMYALSLLQDFVKKNLVYNKPIDKNKELKYLVIYVANLILDISVVEVNLEVILENNINKLKVRFPDKFTEELANNRDLISERKELEK